MIRQAINCDMCGAEKQESNYWFVAYEQGGELKLRGWESPKSSRKDAKHLCGQKCAQRMMANFMALQMASVHNGEQGKEAPVENVDYATAGESREVAERTERLDRTDRSLLGRAVVDTAMLEAESWAGPVRPKEDTWEAQNKVRVERENYLNAPRIKASTPNRLHRMA
jgi:hypothetical protein